jgi:hypothetical protein
LPNVAGSCRCALRRRVRQVADTIAFRRRLRTM